MAEEDVRYQLVVHVAGDVGVRDRFTVEADSLVELDPTYRTDNQDIIWERYGDEDAYIEIRAAFVWRREVSVIQPETDAQPAIEIEGREEDFRQPESGDRDVTIRGETDVHP